MSKLHGIRGKGLSRRRIAVLGALSLLIAIALVAAACGGDDDTPTPIPATATPRPQATATPRPTVPTATPRPAVPTATTAPGDPTPTPIPATATPRPATPVPATATPAGPAGIRAIDEWTCDNPGTMAEVEAILDERHRGESFIIALWGGTEQEMETKAFLNPFSERFDVEIIVSGPPQYAQIEAMAQTGNLLWDVVLTSGGSGAALGLSGALEELDCSVIDRRDWVPTMQSLPWFGGGGETFSYGLMYSTETYPDGGPQPSGWTAYLDTDKFPGRRGLHGDEWFWKYLWPTTLAVEDPSLIATQEGRDSLARLTDEQLSQATELVVDAWLPITDILYTGSETCNQLLLSGDLDMCAQSVGRALAVVKEGLPIKTSFDDGHVASTAGFNVVKGHKEQDPHKFELLQLFNAWINFPEIAADVARGYAYGPYNLAAAEFMVGPDFEEALPYASTGPILGPTAIVPDFQWQGELGSVMVELWLQLQTQAGP